MPEGFRRVVRRASAAVLLRVGGAFTRGRCGRARSSTAAAPSIGGSSAGWIQGAGYLEPEVKIRRSAFMHAGVAAQGAVELGQRVKVVTVLLTLRDAEEQAAQADAQAIINGHTPAGREIAGRVTFVKALKGRKNSSRHP